MNRAFAVLTSLGLLGCVDECFGPKARGQCEETREKFVRKLGIAAMCDRSNGGRLLCNGVTSTGVPVKFECGEERCWIVR